ncbi:lipopolysaccharide biosynthesis protein [Enterococcus cecorum]|nr:lipopolysaccharide biosynthesis protein [Enterococcus cecorum]
MNKKIIIESFVWRLGERIGAQLVSFVVSIILARLLSPKDYGTIALVMVFTVILQVFVDSGFGTALIQKKNADDLDYSSVFYFNIIACLILYGLIFFTAPLISKFYSDPNLILIIRVLGLTIIITGVRAIQQAYVSRNMLFKRFFFSTLGGTLISAVIGLFLAFSGYGVWALVAQQLSNSFFDTLILWITVDWRPKLIFSWKRLKALYSFGWKLLVSALLDTIYSNLRNLIIGKIYSPSDLAYYNQGDKLPKLIITNINTSIDSVLLPTMSNYSDNVEKIKHMTRRSIRISTYIISPILFGLAACSEQLISILLTDKWLACVPYLRIFCITYAFWPVHTANLSAINAMGRSDLFLRLEIIKKVIGLTLLFTTMWFGVMIMAYSLLVSSILSQIINAWPNRRLLNYGYIDQLHDFLPNILISAIMSIIVYLMGFLNLNSYSLLFIQIVIGIFFYISVSAICKLEQFEYLYNSISELIKKRRV